MKLALDTLDDRREIYHLLHRLPPAGRVAYLDWCCRRATLGTSGAHPRPATWLHSRARDAGRCDRADDRLTTEIYVDVVSLANAYRFDLPAALTELVRRVRRV